MMRGNVSWAQALQVRIMVWVIWGRSGRRGGGGPLSRKEEVALAVARMMRGDVSWAQALQVRMMDYEWWAWLDLTTRAKQTD
jgi:hypothetical protein